MKVNFYEAGYVHRIKHRGIFNQAGLFKTMKKWMIHQGYEFEEFSIKHKVPSPGGADQEYKFKGWKRIDAYVIFEINIYCRCFDVKDVEVIKEGKKEMLTSGGLMMEFWGAMEFDYSKRFAKSTPLGRWLGKMYVGWLMDSTYNTKHGDELYYRVGKLCHAVKVYLDFETKSNAHYYQYMW